MKITDLKSNEVKFGSLSAGDTFLFGGHYFLKLTKNARNVNCVNLSKNEIFEMGNDACVVPVKLEVTVK